MNIGINKVNLKSKSLRFEVKHFVTVTRGSCYAILPKDLKLQGGEKYFFEIRRNSSIDSDEFTKLRLIFSSVKTYLSVTYADLPGRVIESEIFSSQSLKQN